MRACGDHLSKPCGADLARRNRTVPAVRQEERDREDAGGQGDAHGPVQEQLQHLRHRLLREALSLHNRCSHKQWLAGRVQPTGEDNRT